MTTLSQLFPSLHFEERAWEIQIEKELNELCAMYPEFKRYIGSTMATARSDTHTLSVWPDGNKKTGQLLWEATLRAKPVHNDVRSSGLQPSAQAAILALAEVKPK